MPKNDYNIADDARGASKITVDAVREITGIVEALHKTILHVGGIRGPLHKTRTRGITGFVFRIIYKIIDIVGYSTGKLLAQLSIIIEKKTSTLQREAIISALNGVIGDYLETSENPLAIQMQFRKNGKVLTFAEITSEVQMEEPRILLMIHGLCMNDLQWTQKGYNHGEKIARELGYTPLYLHYNTGRHISTNGREFSELLEKLTSFLPEKSTFSFLTHSMGGLVSRSAIHYAKLNDFTWHKKLRKLVFLGTPHFGAPMERGGNWLETLLEANPFSAPFARLGKVRSSGITDLRYGNLTDDDWENKDRFDRSLKPISHLPLPDSIDCYAVATTTSKREGLIKTEIIGDGLVPLKSALGQHEEPGKSLNFPPEHTLVLRKENHLGLLNNPEVYKKLSFWLAN